MTLNLRQHTIDRRPALIRRVLFAGSWTIFGFGFALASRFLGNLILTRLLFPEAFGLMVIVQAVITGVTMLSDLGIEQSIVYHSRGDSAEFLNTAWTLNIIRNVFLWVAICALATPIAFFYGEPIISQVLPVAGLAGIIASFSSTNLASADRNLIVAKATLINTGSYVTGLTSTIILAWADHSIWSLVVGNIIGTGLRTVGSHVLLGGISNKFAWDHGSIRAMTSFGRWIFLSSALTFLVGEGTRLLVGSLLPITMLAFFNLAISMAQLPLQIVQQLAAKVLLPAYSEVVRERPERLYNAIAKARLVQIVPHWLISTFFVYFGPALMELLYDNRYKDAGWMLQLLGLGWLCGCLSSSYSGVLLAKGSAHLNTLLLVNQLLIQTACMYAGYYLGGTRGLVIGVSTAFWILYPITAYLYFRLCLWQPRIDLPFLGLSLLITISVLGRLMPP